MSDGKVGKRKHAEAELKKYGASAFFSLFFSTCHDRYENVHSFSPFPALALSLPSLHPGTWLETYDMKEFWHDAKETRRTWCRRREMKMSLGEAQEEEKRVPKIRKWMDRLTRWDEEEGCSWCCRRCCCCCKLMHKHELTLLSICVMFIFLANRLLQISRQSEHVTLRWAWSFSGFTEEREREFLCDACVKMKHTNWR